MNWVLNYICLQIWNKLTVLYSFNLVDYDVLANNSKAVTDTNIVLFLLKKNLFDLTIQVILILNYNVRIRFLISKFAISYQYFFIS